MRKKVVKTIKRACMVADDNPSIDPVALPCVAASTPFSFSSASADSTNNISQYAKSDPDQLKLPLKKHKGSNKNIGGPEHKKTMAFTYQVAWNFQSSPQRSIFASAGDGTVTGTPNGPPIHRPLPKSKYLDALGKAISEAVNPCSESVHQVRITFGLLPPKQKGFHQ
jgi:hypothetical protein